MLTVVVFGDLALDRLRVKHGSDLDVEWKIAMVKDGEAVGYTSEALGWMYRRSESITGIAVTSRWIQGNDRTLYANLAVAAAGRLGHDVRRQVAEAILLRVEPGARKSTQEFRALTVTDVPTFLFRNEIDDAALLSGLCEFETLDQAIAEMLRAESGLCGIRSNAPSPA